jgi:hypothetical protein
MDPIQEVLLEQKVRSLLAPLSPSANSLCADSLPMQMALANATTVHISSALVQTLQCGEITSHHCIMSIAATDSTVKTALVRASPQIVNIGGVAANVVSETRIDRS